MSDPNTVSSADNVGHIVTTAIPFGTYCRQCGRLITEDVVPSDGLCYQCRRPSVFVQPDLTPPPSWGEGDKYVSAWPVDEHKAFLREYIMRRASAHIGGLNGRGAALGAEKAWKEMNRILKGESNL